MKVDVYDLFQAKTRVVVVDMTRKEVLALLDDECPTLVLQEKDGAVWFPKQQILKAVIIDD